MNDTFEFRSISPKMATVAEGLPSFAAPDAGTTDTQRNVLEELSFDYDFSQYDGSGWTPPEGGFSGGWTPPVMEAWAPPEGGFGGGWTPPETGGWTPPEGGGWTPPEGGFGGGGNWTPPETGGWTPPEGGFGGYTPGDVGDALDALEPEIITIMVDGIPRSFGIIMPADFDPDETYSAIMTFHGGGDLGTDPEAMSALTSFSGYDNPAQFIEIYPIGAGDTWSWDPENAEYDDVAFIEALVDEVVTNYNVDPDQIYAAGISGGGMFVQSLALEVPDLFNGYAVVAANMMEVLTAEAVANTSDTPMIIFHGSEDPGQPYNGITGWNGQTIMYGSEASADFWADRNDTEMGDFVALPDIADDGMSVIFATSEDGSVEHYVVLGGGHSWPGTLDATQDINASELIVDFFEDYGF